MSKEDVVDLFENTKTEEPKNNFNILVAHYLVHSYLYYILGSSVISDAEYDSICSRLLENLDMITHQHRHLIDKEALKAGSAFHLAKDDYPLIVRNCAKNILDEYNIRNRGRKK